MVFIRPVSVCLPIITGTQMLSLLELLLRPGCSCLEWHPPSALSHAKADFSRTLWSSAVSALTDDHREDTGQRLWRGERGVILVKSGSLCGSRFFKCMTSWLLFPQKMQEAEEILSSWQTAPSQLSSRAFFLKKCWKLILFTLLQ